VLEETGGGYGSAHFVRDEFILGESETKPIKPINHEQPTNWRLSISTRPSEIWSGHIDKITQASDYPTIAAVEGWVGRRIALLFRETCSRFHRCKCRNAVPHLEGTQDVFGKVAMGEESASRRDIALNFTAEVSVYGTFVCAVKSGQKVCAESI
jgi:hypothetical protein